ncbi:hypothetical protein [Streptomyces lydicus]|uniref:hypothetical protein n=1 Tax=Streptomyces lydicus TaxID=47763 RepID=UPI0010138829|nr:hypothetical protein [Streptomyces lydicus]MCZ1006907.1 hypothetical protein [Streptomyces lydicus]
MAGALQQTTLIVLAKEPVPGRTKELLAPSRIQVEVARRVEAALVDTPHLVLRAPAGQRVLAPDRSLKIGKVSPL